MSKKILLYLSSFILILLFVFRNLVLNLSANLLDWRDYPYVIWVIFQNITHISSLDFINFFETNAFYPHKLTLLFSDILLPQSLIMLPILIFTKNLILSFNLLFIITFILNFISSFLLWKQIFKKELIAFFGSLFLVFSPFFQLELSHFQMLTFWPFLFSLYFIFKNEEKPSRKNLIAAGLLLSIQFLASIYLAVYLIFSISIFSLLKFFSHHKKETILKILFIFTAFLLTSGIFIKGYIDMKHMYNVNRDIKEYITYSANLSDYIFTSQINSIVHQSPIMKLWNKSDKNWGAHSSFPGFLIFVFSIYGLFQLSKRKQLILLNLKLNQEKAFFLALVIMGFTFSLGPRLNFNGNYAHIPLPYDIFIKYVPLADATRVPVRWSFIFFLGLIYFALIGIKKLQNKFKHSLIISIFILIIFLLEYIPLNITASSQSYISNKDIKLKELCSKDKKVVLELPVTHLDVVPDIVTGLSYITKMELASTYHGCFMTNGYSGYDLPSLFELRDSLSDAIVNKDIIAFQNLIRKNMIDIVIFNPELFIKELEKPGYVFIQKLQKEADVAQIDNNAFLFTKSFQGR